MSFLNNSFDKVKRGFNQVFFPQVDASYVVRIDSATTFMVKKKEVVKVAVTILDTHGGEGALRPGSEACVWYDDGNPEGGEEMLARNTKTMLCEITGKAAEEITGAQAAAALAEGGDLEGCIIRIDSMVRAKKKSAGNFVAFKFSTPFSEEEIKALPAEAQALLG